MQESLRGLALFQSILLGLLLPTFFLFSGCKNKGFTSDAAKIIGSTDLSSSDFDWADGSLVGPGLGSGYTSSFSALGASSAVKLPVQSTSCLNDNSVDACVFKNGPVYQIGIKLTPYSQVSDLTELQVWGVTLSDLDASTYLQNTFISMYGSYSSATLYPRAQSSSGVWQKYEYKGSTKPQAVQAHNYVFMTAMRKFITEKAGFFPAAYGSNTVVKVYANSDYTYAQDNAFFQPGDNQIHLGSSSMLGTAYFLGSDADVGLHEYGHGILNFNSANRDQDTNSNWSSCSSAGFASSGYCCLTYNGCIGSIHEGQADFHAVIMNPSDPRIGMTFVNSLKGLRNAAAYKSMLKTTAGNEFHAQGRLYTSIWFEVYKQTLFHDDIIKIFFETQKLIVGADTFVTVLAKIKTVDQTFFAGQYSALFDAEFKRRGL